MRTFYIIRMIDGRYVHEADQHYTLYCDELDKAALFGSEEEAVNSAPSWGPFTIIKFYDK